VSTLAVSWGGTVSLSTRTLARVIVEIVDALARHGFRSFVLVNYQADPDHLKAMAAAGRALTGRRGVRVAFAGFTPGAQIPSAMMNSRVRDLMRSPRPEREWHSGELETSLMLARQPRSCVAPSPATCGRCGWTFARSSGGARGASSSSIPGAAATSAPRPSPAPRRATRSWRSAPAHRPRGDRRAQRWATSRPIHVDGRVEDVGARLTHLLQEMFTRAFWFLSKRNRPVGPT